MTDPLAEVVTLLQPSAPFSKLVTARGAWRVQRDQAGRPFYCAVLDGSCRLAVAGRAPVTLQAGDFILIPAAYDFVASSMKPPAADTTPIALRDGELRHGLRGGGPDVRMLVGHCTFGSQDAALLVSLLPSLVHVRGQDRLATLVQLVRDESRERRPARDVILARLLEVLLIEALRASSGIGASPGLVRGLADERIGVALRRMHERPAKAWTIAQLAKEAGLSRSTFFERFDDAVGVAPMEYLVGWRIALAKDLLRRGQTVGEVATQVGYSSATTFSAAFTRHAGTPPSHYARASAPPSARRAERATLRSRPRVTSA